MSHGVIVTERSGNAKLGDISSTMVAQNTCPDDCALRRAGCYAERGLVNLHTMRINRQAKVRKRAKDALRIELAKLEAKKIRLLTGLRKLRGHVVGDCPTAASARIVGPAMVEHEQKHGKAAWTYTHAWRRIAFSMWKGARVLASCNTVREIPQARQRGYGTAVIVPEHPTNKIYTLQGERIIPCPAQFERHGKRLVTCEFCTLCSRGNWLRDNKLSIGFQPDKNTGGPKLLKMLEAR